MTHTPGPWATKAQGDANYYMTLSNGCWLAAIQFNGELLVAEQEANARLIDAAPELLAALQEMVDVHDEPCRIDHKGFCQSHFLDHVDEGGCRVANAKAAIAKATGQTK